MVKQLFTFLFVTVSFFAATANTARIQSLSNNEMFSDPSSILNRPSNIALYKNIIQGTAFGETDFGPIIVTKSLGDMFTLGAYAVNTTESKPSSILYGTSFVSKANSFLSTLIVTSPLKDQYLTLPHLVAGVNIGDNLRIGVDLFYERTGYSKNDTTFNDSEDIINLETVKTSLTNVGGRFDISIGIGETFLINPFITFAKPGVNGESTSKKVTGSGDAKRTETVDKVVSASQSMHFHTGALFAYKRDRTNFKLLGSYLIEKREFTGETKTTILTTDDKEVEDDKKTSPYSETMRFNIYAGALRNVSNNIDVGAAYRFTAVANGTVTESADEDADPTITASTTLYHKFSTAVERTGKGFWIFDEFSSRLGINYLVSTEYSGSDSEFTGTMVGDPANSVGFTLNSGIGVRRGIGALDLSLTLGKWEGAFVGPQAASATITVDFGKNSESTSASSSSSSSSESSSSNDDEIELDL